MYTPSTFYMKSSVPRGVYKKVRSGTVGFIRRVVQVLRGVHENGRLITVWGSEKGRSATVGSI